MVGILNLAGNGTCWISALKGKVVVVGEALVFLAASFSSLSLSLLISSFMGEKAGRSSLLLEVVELHLPLDDCAYPYLCFDQVDQTHCGTT